ncbi:YidB family protein [Streptomyces palmae]|uniref:DUF937 domain-containing protein n=1 Tax=Streptomyces palmae TaxID=1701085 RepID=A0A4Z0HDY1_9ACTN|nr:YidB family protein [Streptomyces palmae]TGB17098.1 DUF937 domain-containing protein [Streptomyces palmae]
MAGNELGSLLSGLLGRGQDATSEHLLGTLLGDLGSGSGSGGNALNGLLEQLQDGGLAEQARSWVGTGANTPVTGPELAQALPYQTLNHVAGQAGVAPEEAADRLAVLLPEVVDRLTPEGQVPQGSLEEVIERHRGG